jgi:hypothetical protein
MLEVSGARQQRHKLLGLAHRAIAGSPLDVNLQHVV